MRCGFGIAISMVGIVVFLASAPAQAQALDREQIETVTGLKGSYSQEERVFKVSRPRTDLKVSVEGWSMPPYMGLTSWAAFTPAQDGRVMVMGDLVLLEDEVNAVMSAALESGLEVTALHNHFFFDQPKVYFMHIGGMGDTDTLAAGVRHALRTVDRIRAASPRPAPSFGPPDIPTTNSIAAEPLDRILRVKGQASQGMYKAVFGREATMHDGTRVAKEMGVNTWAAFAGSDETAVVDGDFAVLENELQPVLKSLRGHGINIVAIHHHMTHESPRLLFLHYWGKGKAADLAGAVKATLAVQAGVH
jgi:hypothetical protein